MRSSPCIGKRFGLVRVLLFLHISILLFLLFLFSDDYVCILLGVGNKFISVLPPQKGNIKGRAMTSDYLSRAIRERVSRINMRVYEKAEKQKKQNEDVKVNFLKTHNSQRSSNGMHNYMTNAANSPGLK